MNNDFFGHEWDDFANVTQSRVKILANYPNDIFLHFLVMQPLDLVHPLDIQGRSVPLHQEASGLRRGCP